jgi:hypothetical protein
VSHCVSNRPIQLADAAKPEAALPPTTQRIAGSWRSRSESCTLLVSGKPPKNGLSQHADQRMPPFLPVQASASLSTGKSERPSGIIKFAVREQSGVRGLDRTAKHEISLRSA